MKSDKDRNRPQAQRKSIFEEVKLAKNSAESVLIIAKQIEKVKSKTHHWVTSPDGKTQTLKLIKPTKTK